MHHQERLAVRLERILADDVVSRDERDLAARLVREAKLPEATKCRVLKRLAGWEI